MQNNSPPPLLPREYRLITTDIVVFGCMMLGMILLALRWAEPDERSSLWTLLLWTVAVLAVSLTLWIRNRARLVRRDTAFPPWWVAAAVSLISIGPAMYFVGTLAWHEVTSWLATPAAVGYWLLARTLASRLLDRRGGATGAMA